MNKYFLTLLFCLSVSAPSLGQGLRPAPLIAGDTAPSPLVATGSSNYTNSSIFSVSPEQIPLIINLRTDTYSHNTHQYMGKRNVLTLRTNTLNAMQTDLVAAILQLNLNAGKANSSHNMIIDVNESQLAQIQNVLVSSVHNHQTSQQTWLFNYLPVVRRFCHWAVMLGVVFATIMLAVAAYGVVMSHRGSADKVISTVAGLMVLLMAYTIYCLLIANAGNHQTINQTIQSSPLP
jgi:hypothetical protein